MYEYEYDIMRELEDDYWWYHGLHRMTADAVTRHAPSLADRVINGLDAGCGTGGTLDYMAQRFQRIHFVGMDYMPIAVMYTQKRARAPVLQGSVNTLPFAENTFDFILSMDVLYIEGVDDQQALHQFHHSLKKNGLLVMNLPAFEWLRSEHDQAVRTRHRYTRKEVETLLCQSGFQIIKLSYWNMFLFPAVCTLRLLHSRPRETDLPQSDLKPLPLILNRLLKLILNIEVGLMRLFNLPVGTSVFCVARKTGS